MNAVSLTQKQAKEYINQNHRHHKASVGDVFRIGYESDGKLVGVVQCGRPVSRCLDDGQTLDHSEAVESLPEWSKFVSTLYDEIINNKYPRTDNSFKIPLTKVQKYKLQKKGIPEIFLIDL